MLSNKYFEGVPKHTAMYGRKVWKIRRTKEGGRAQNTTPSTKVFVLVFIKGKVV